MSNGARAGVVALAVAIVVIAFVALKPSDSSDKKDSAKRTADTTTVSDAKKNPKAGTPLAPPPPREITLKGGAPEGGVKSIKVGKGDDVQLRVNTDESHDTLHLHGYDLEEDASAKKPAIFKFKAKVEGVFELESHTAEDAGREPLIARLVVEPN